MAIRRARPSREILSGDSADVYFARAETVLDREGLDPVVTMEVFARADAIRRESVERLGAEGVPASGDTGEADPLDAIEDALETFDAERIVLFTHPQSDQRYREDVDEAAIAQRFGRPVDRAEVADES